MASPIDGQTIRRVLLEVINEHAQKGSGYLQSGGVLGEAAQRLGLRHNVGVEQALLALFYDLFRTGHLSWGYNLSNADPPFCHLTDQGCQTLQHLSRDPANPDGYMTHLSRQGSLNPIANSYLQEALATYNSNCLKATAVMIGAAAESLMLELREVLVTRINLLGRTPSVATRPSRVRI